MADFKVVVSDPKTKSYQFDVKGPEANKFIGKAIGQDIDGSIVGLSGYKLVITGGSDKSGMVMRPDLPGPKRKRILVSTGVGYSPKADGMRRRKTMHGKEISPNIVQINTKVIEYGEKSIEEIIGGDKTEE
ncbi:ribosomal protein S6E (S10) [Methanomethylovorans hollandica DSM 15978]|uniref:Small ribosomal subunit protein eS6 n=1 Tax=Methanomethylovorans hollandica (strain DSM 15978 / NBRC 107637 / DMS1) TaxID=867904 RepID=L0L041_METHD|nr:30S ribosomal protein S6e [Methanomethylovorans hollandica]AGB49723.1 ribosomal protein S6E (S10) [Methanomethylovorans hollandica DSM 15978]